MQTATLGLVNYLFGNYGLVVVVPDSPVLKSVAIDLFKDELLHQRSSGIVGETAQKLVEAGYKAQAHGRDINLFYLKDNGERLRIERDGDSWMVLDSDIRFTEEALLNELASHPERFSPNVILRGLFQEMILPNIIFVGGGGELAYWLELKGIFDHYKVPYPLLVLRNSFLIINRKQVERITKLNFTQQELFLSSLGLKNKWVKANSQHDLSTEQAQLTIKNLFESLADQAAPIDPTLKRHIYALQKQEERNIVELGKKFLRAEKKNYNDAMRQIDKLKQQLFPNNNLQERVDNILPYLACWGPGLIDILYQNSYAFEQQLVAIAEH
ncbi:bacillithiol biosynthesis cysteine-adding enzyme BshC [Niabella hibiscisoli]|nr:bacillithiol biosynthesis cysteine-adding enzyme BshC [Niabella hibiscisoli]MCH5720613.1 bacillithiol biosynthesis cysteine-adding enzyme BshC [Niabella hibiscisoli]